MNNLGQSIQELGARISPWVYVPILVLVFILILQIIKGILFSKLKKIAERTRFQIDDIVLESARFPTTLLIFAAGIYLLKLFLPLDAKGIQAISVAVQGMILTSIILFLDRVVRKFGTTFGQKKEFAFFSQGILQGVIRGLIIGLGLLIFLDMIGISITPVLASLGIGSLAVALGLQETLTNFFAGIYITIDKPVQVGDFIKLESGEEGYVTEVGWRATRIRMLPNNTVIVPNQKLMSTIITNYYLPSPDLAVLVQVGVEYDSDLKKVEEVTVDVARQIMKKVQGAVADFDPFIRYHTFGESSINFTVILRGREFVDQHLIKHEFVKALHDRYQKEGIVIPYRMHTIDFTEETLKVLKERA